MLHDLNTQQCGLFASVHPWSYLPSLSWPCFSNFCALTLAQLTSKKCNWRLELRTRQTPYNTANALRYLLTSGDRSQASDPVSEQGYSKCWPSASGQVTFKKSLQWVWTHNTKHIWQVFIPSELSGQDRSLFRGLNSQLPVPLAELLTLGAVWHPAYSLCLSRLWPSPSGGMTSIKSLGGFKLAILTFLTLWPGQSFDLQL